MRSLLYLLLLCGACTASESTDMATPATDPTDPLDWSKNANIYEVNIRQYTPEGTINAFAQHLPRLKDMGVEILWLMPIYPISEKNRKGSLGSYYAASDFKAVNPEFGTLDDVKALIDKAHDIGMKVILDYVPNHTGFDHVWTREHPEYYTKNAAGEITDPLDEDGKSMGWTDVADLDYDNPGTRAAVIDVLKYWITEADIDGYRMDVGFLAPDDFWAEAIPQLQEIKPLFMLAESDHPYHRNSGLFDMNFGWPFHHLLNDLAQGKANANDIDTFRLTQAEKYERGYYMHFLDNHDENSWNGTIEERMGEAADALAVLAFTLEGMPLLYSGQEAGLDKRLKFFEKDAIDWRDFPKQDFYKTLLLLKRDNEALWNGEAGGRAERIRTNLPEEIYAYQREKNGDKVVVVINLSDTPQAVELAGDRYVGTYNDVFNNQSRRLTPDMRIELGPWEYLVLENRN